MQLKVNVLYTVKKIFFLNCKKTKHETYFLTEVAFNGKIQCVYKTQKKAIILKKLIQSSPLF